VRESVRGNGRSGEDKNVGRVAVGGGFVHQPLALHDAEAVLFVNRDETKARELDVVFDEGVRATTSCASPERMRSRAADFSADFRPLMRSSTR